MSENMAVQVHRPSALPDGLRYYLLRGSIMVPLVPVDQVPFQLQGVPRRLTHRQMSDGNWKLLHETDHPAALLSIQAPGSILPPQPAPSPKPRFFAPDYHVRNEPANNIEDMQRKSWSTLLDAAKKPPGTDTPQSTKRPLSFLDRFATIYPRDAQIPNYRMTYPSGIEPDPSKKKYCSHWIKTGECAFTQTGCRYKHEMPSRDKLGDLGFRDLPKWWKEKSAIVPRSKTWLQRQLRTGDEDNEQSADIPAPRAFSDHFTSTRRQNEDISQTHYALPARRIPLRTGNPPSVSVSEATIRPECQIPNLLIDVDVPSSPQLELLVTAGSCDTSGCSRRSSDSSLASRTTTQSKSPTVAEPVAEYVPAGVRKQTERPCQPVVRRHSSLSWSSDSKEVQPESKRLGKRENTSRKATRRPHGPTKQQAGLATSKHAAVEPNAKIRQAKDAAGKTNINSTKIKNAEAHNKNTNRKMPKNKGDQGGATELYSQIEHLRRNTHHKDRTRKSAAGEVGEAGAAPVAVNKVPIRWTH